MTLFVYERLYNLCMTTNWRKQFGTINGHEERYRKGN